MIRATSIAIEGLCCVGKTTLAQRLATGCAEAALIPEVVLQRQPPLNETGFRSFYYRNDLQKSEAMRELSAGSKIVVLDRYYVSTICHFAASRQLRNPVETDIDSTLHELHADHYSTAMQPALWVFLRSDSVRSWERYRRLRVVDESSIWISREGTRLIADAMEACLHSREICSGNTLVLDADADVDQLAARVWQAIGV